MSVYSKHVFEDIDGLVSLLNFDAERFERTAQNETTKRDRLVASEMARYIRTLIDIIEHSDLKEMIMVHPQYDINEAVVELNTALGSVKRAEWALIEIGDQIKTKITELRELKGEDDNNG